MTAVVRRDGRVAADGPRRPARPERHLVNRLAGLRRRPQEAGAGAPTWEAWGEPATVNAVLVRPWRRRPETLVASEDLKPDRPDELARPARAAAPSDRRGAYRGGGARDAPTARAQARGRLRGDADAARRPAAAPPAVARLDGNLAGRVARPGRLRLQGRRSLAPGDQKVSCAPEFILCRPRRRPPDPAAPAASSLAMSNEAAAAPSRRRSTAARTSAAARACWARACADLHSKDNMTLLVVQVGVDGAAYGRAPDEIAGARATRVRPTRPCAAPTWTPALLRRHGRPATAGAGARVQTARRPRRQSTRLRRDGLAAAGWAADVGLATADRKKRPLPRRTRVPQVPSYPALATVDFPGRRLSRCTRRRTQIARRHLTDYAPNEAGAVDPRRNVEEVVPLLRDRWRRALPARAVPRSSNRLPPSDGRSASRLGPPAASRTGTPPPPRRVGAAKTRARPPVTICSASTSVYHVAPKQDRHFGSTVSGRGGVARHELA